MKRVLFLPPLLLLTLSTSLLAQQGSLEGTVLNALTHEPLSGVHVRLIPGNSVFAASTVYGATSDRDGHFSMASLQPGTYQLMPERNGYLFVQSKTDPAVGSITIKAGRKITDFRFEMTPRAVISGRVVDEAGDPVPDVRMGAVSVTPGREPMPLRSPPIVYSNDRGEFRILTPPGKYYVQAAPYPQTSGGNEGPEKRTDGTSPVVYGATFFPSTPRKDRATPVDAVAGKETGGIEIRLTSAQQGLSISGTVTGAPAGGANRTSVVLMLMDSSTHYSFGHNAMAGPDGKFRFDGLAPGHYTLSARFEGSKALMISRTVQGELETESVNVDLVVTSGIELSGNVTIEGETAGNQASCKVSLERADGVVIYGGNPGLNVAGGLVDASGNFTITGIFPMKYRIKLGPQLENAYVKELRIDGTRSADHLVDLSQVTQAASIKVIMAANGGQVTGKVVGADTSEVKLPGLRTMVFLAKSPEDIKFTPTQEFVSPDGKFTLYGVPPGKYRLIVLNSIPSVGVASIFDKAEEFEVKEGDRIVKEVKITKLEIPIANQ
jgi:hypothetical protein